IVLGKDDGVVVENGKKPQTRLIVPAQLGETAQTGSLVRAERGDGKTGAERYRLVIEAQWPEAEVCQLPVQVCADRIPTVRSEIFRSALDPPPGTAASSHDDMWQANPNQQSDRKTDQQHERSHR